MLHEEDTIQIQFAYEGVNESADFELAPTNAEAIKFTLWTTKKSEVFEIELAPFSLTIDAVAALPLLVVVVDSEIALQLAKESNGWMEDVDNPQPMVQIFRNADQNAKVTYRLGGIVIVGTVDFGGGDRNA